MLKSKAVSFLLLAQLTLSFQCLSVLSLSSSVTARPTSTRKAESDSRAASVSKRAVVVGGGPSGLAVALTLSRPPHSYDVIVLERSTEQDAVSSYDASRAYLYNINPRGLTWLDMHPEALAKLEERGSSPKTSYGSIVYVPAEPEKKIPIENKQQAQVSKGSDIPSQRNYWLPRHQMVGLLQECCLEQEATRIEQNRKDLGSIQLLSGKRLCSMESSSSEDANGGQEEKVTLTCTDGSTYSASLVVGADGINSAVRSCLNDQSGAETSSSSWLHSNGRSSSFRLKKYKSPSTGLRVKSLQLPPGFTLPDSDGSEIPTESETMYVIRSVNKGTRNYVSLGLLPIKDSTMARAANIVTRFDHEVWGLETGPAVKAWFQKAFPRWDFDNMIDDREWERFAKAKATSFPHCQYSPGSAVVSPKGMAGVVLVGDACHAFPPDIGQGINAGLDDVVALDRALRGEDIQRGKKESQKQERPNLGAALLAYQRNRGPEHKALIRLARFGAPYQYKQPWRRDRLGRLLWTANVAFRLLLNKISFGLIPPAAIVLAFQAKKGPLLTFRQVMRRADSTALAIKLLLLGLLGWLGSKWLIGLV